MAVDKISLIFPYYNNKDMLTYHFSKWENYDKSTLDRVEFVIVDDGSKTAPAKVPLSGLNITLAVIEEDLYWNLTGAKNLGMKLATSHRCLLTDIDHEVSEEVLLHCLNMEFIPNTFWLFQRKNHDGSKRSTHTGTMLLSKDDFWRVGGYDENFSGNYSGGDLDLSNRLRHYGVNREFLPWHIISHDTNMSIQDSTCGPRYKKNLAHIRDEISINTEKAKNKLVSDIPLSHCRFSWRIK